MDRLQDEVYLDIDRRSLSEPRPLSACTRPGSSPAAPSSSSLAAAGVRSTPGVLIVPLETEFGWSRATISFAVAVNIVLYGLIGPFAAALLERFGLRRTVAARWRCWRWAWRSRR